MTAEYGDGDPDEDLTENVGYAVPGILLLHVLQDYTAALDARTCSNSGSEDGSSGGSYRSERSIQSSNSSSDVSSNHATGSSSRRIFPGGAREETHLPLKGMPYFGVSL